VKKEIFEWVILSWTFLLVLLIFGWIMIEFYDWMDTIVAAIIAFAGAIIGGSITLIGVKMTLDNAKEKNEINNLHVRKQALNKTINQLVENRQMIYIKQNQNRSFEDSLGELLVNLNTSDGILDNSVSSSRKAYDEVIKLNECIHGLRWGEGYYLPDKNKYGILDLGFTICIDSLIKEKSEIIEKLLTKHPN